MTNKYFLLTVMFLAVSLISAMEIELKPNVLYADVAQKLAYAIVTTTKQVNKDTINELFKALQTISWISKDARVIKNLLFGTDNASKQFHAYIIDHLSEHVQLQRVGKKPKKCEVLANYLGTPCALALLSKTLFTIPEPISFGIDHARLLEIVDAKTIKRSVKKYKKSYEGPPSGGWNNSNLYSYEEYYENIEEDESLEDALQKFPTSTQLRWKEWLKGKIISN